MVVCLSKNDSDNSNFVNKFQLWMLVTAKKFNFCENIFVCCQKYIYFEDFKLFEKEIQPRIYILDLIFVKWLENQDLFRHNQTKIEKQKLKTHNFDINKIH